jgi:MoxR-like ATPase
VVEETVQAVVDELQALSDEVGKVIVGQREVVDGVITCMLAGGNALLEGVPGLGKTLLVRSLAEALELTFSRIQFTPDLMPADVVGTEMITEDKAGRRELVFRKGPIFSHIVLADEINRATPKTQSALLEAMQEKSVTVGGETRLLERPFMVLATQNPLEMEGTYPLPEAQLDRFLLKLIVPFPDRADLHTILDRTTSTEEAKVSPAMSRGRILEIGSIVREVPVERSVQDFAIRILEGTHPDHPEAPETTKRFVRFGASPRGVQAMLLAAKVRALRDGRFSVSRDDVRALAGPALRHRIILNFEGEAEGVEVDKIISTILQETADG